MPGSPDLKETEQRVLVISSACTAEAKSVSTAAAPCRLRGHADRAMSLRRAMSDAPTRIPDVASKSWGPGLCVFQCTYL